MEIAVILSASPAGISATGFFMKQKKGFGRLYLWVLLAIYLGGMAGYFWPESGDYLKPVADGFIALIKMLIGPIVFCTIVMGISTAGDMRKVGRLGVKTLVYFEITSVAALFLGLLIGNWAMPGDGFHATAEALDSSVLSAYTVGVKDQTVSGFLLGIIPHTFSSAFSGTGNLLQVLLVSVLFGYALNHMGAKGKAVHTFIEEASHIFFAMMNVILRLAPLGAGAAMAFTVGKYGIESLKPLAVFMGWFYATCLFFIFGCLGVVAWMSRFSLWKFMRYIKEEILIVLGTSSSESVLPLLMAKLENMGCKRETVGLVVPSGYSFNLDGTSIYITLATLFVAQALDIDLTWGQQATIFAVALLTSKGAAGVTGSGFVTLAATLAVVDSTVPVAGLALILGIDRFMSEARAITNLIGNGVAAVAMSRWEKELDDKVMDKALSGAKQIPV